MSAVYRLHTEEMPEIRSQFHRSNSEENFIYGDMMVWRYDLVGSLLISMFMFMYHVSLPLSSLAAARYFRRENMFDD